MVDQAVKSNEADASGKPLALAQTPFVPQNLAAAAIAQPKRLLPQAVCHDQYHGEIRVRGNDKALVVWFVGTPEELKDKKGAEIVKVLGAGHDRIASGKDPGPSKVSWKLIKTLEGEARQVLSIHLSTFSIDPSNPRKVERSVVEALIAEEGAVVLDHSPNGIGQLREFHCKLREEEIPAFRVLSVGAFAARLVEFELENGVKIIDALDDQLKQYETVVADDPLPRVKIHDEIPELRDTVNYVGRKISEVQNVLQKLQEANSSRTGALSLPCFYSPEEDPHIVNQDAFAQLSGIDKRLSDLKSKINKISDEHDRQARNIGSGAAEKTAIFVAICTPVLVGGEFNKVVLANHEGLHKYSFLVFTALGIGFAVWGKLTKWRGGLPAFVNAKNLLRLKKLLENDGD